ncbi:Uncharacterized protein HZ326_22798 [Fusarium oxysporum f. sp. albedinis]|nr:Uncharacterized protein HZ326_22798 [Fusarium oxysporum f. sp. albedinis]
MLFSSGEQVGSLPDRPLPLGTASKGVQTDVGLQGRADPLIIKSRRLLIRGPLAALLALLRQATPSNFSRRRIPKAAISVSELNVKFRCSAMNITVIMTV